MIPFYAFSLVAGNYTMRLYFAENNRVNPNDRVFGVEVNGVTVATQVDIVSQVGVNAVLSVEITNIMVTSLSGLSNDTGILSVSLLRRIGNPKINALEVYNVSYGEYASNTTYSYSWASLAYPETVRRAPLDNLKVACGQGNNVVVSDGDVWVADTLYVTPSAVNSTESRS